MVVDVRRWQEVAGGVNAASQRCQSDEAVEEVCERASGREKSSGGKEFNAAWLLVRGGSRGQ